MNNTKLSIPFRVILAFTTCLLLYGIASAQNDQVKGVINERNGATMTVQSQEGGNVTVVLTPSTQVEEPEGIFREKHLAMTALIPGLAVRSQGILQRQEPTGRGRCQVQWLGPQNRGRHPGWPDSDERPSSTKSKTNSGRTTKTSARTATAYGRRAKDCGQQSSYCGSQQALRRVG